MQNILLNILLLSGKPPLILIVFICVKYFGDENDTATVRQISKLKSDFRMICVGNLC